MIAASRFAEVEAGHAAASVSYRNVTKRYPGQDKPAIHDLSLDVKAEEICVLVGPSGSGKTTALRMVNTTVWRRST
jgi:osmoprotectant transport system ATP-binding protein